MQRQKQQQQKLSKAESGTGEEMSIEDGIEGKKIEFAFTPSLSYAEKLMLKQHRQQQRQHQQRGRRSVISEEEGERVERFFGDEDEDEELQPRISFESIFNVVRQSEAIRKKLDYTVEEPRGLTSTSSSSSPEMQPDF